MKHGSLFSGIGGFDLAAEWMGWENVFHCENNKFCQKILKHYWPDAKSYGDIKETDFSEWEGSVDIISGGFPCQPYSQAGKRKGKEDERHLWPEMLRAIREVQPRWVVGENVSGLLNWNGGMVLDEIKADLEAAGFEVFPPLVLPACSVNAPHRRDRVWIVAHTNKNSKSVIAVNENKRCRKLGVITHATSERKRSGANKQAENDRSRQQLDWSEPWRNNHNNGKSRVTTNSLNSGFETEGKFTKPTTQNSRIGYMRGRWDGFPTQPPICGRNDGISNRVDRIKALGNSVVPQVVYEIFKAIQQIENNQ